MTFEILASFIVIPAGIISVGSIIFFLIMLLASIIKEWHDESCDHCNKLHKKIKIQEKELKLLRPFNISFSE